MTQLRKPPRKSETLEKKALEDGTTAAAKAAVDAAEKEFEEGRIESLWGDDESPLDPEKYLGSKPLMAQNVGGRMSFVAKYVQQYLDKHHGRNGKFQWRVAFISPEQVPEYIAEWDVLTPTRMGPAWMKSRLAQQLGLIIHEGAICWPGMALEEKFILMTQTKQRRKELKEYQDKQIADMLRPPDVDNIEGVKSAEWDTKEERKQHARLEEFPEDPELAASSA